MSNTRREFLQTTAAATAALGLTGFADAADAGLPQRPLGRTGVKVSIICLGGWHIGAVAEDREAIRIMQAAIDEGVNFFDNAWDYHNGRSEELMGKALKEGKRREKVFLMTKNCERDGKGSVKCLEDSLRRLQTDHIDLWQFHEIIYDNDPEWVVEKGGLEAALKAQKDGKVRFIGFTGHKSPHIHLKMLEKHPWDTVQLPINACDPHYRSFIKEVLPRLNEKQVAPIGMKSLGGGSGGKGRFPVEKVCTVDEARRFALSQPIASLVVGIDSMDILKQDVAMARNFKAMSNEEQKNLLQKVKPVAGDGRHERFKSTQFYDGPHHRKQHGLSENEVKGQG